MKYEDLKPCVLHALAVKAALPVVEDCLPKADKERLLGIYLDHICSPLCRESSDHVEAEFTIITSLGNGGIAYRGITLNGRYDEERCSFNFLKAGEAETLKWVLAPFVNPYFHDFVVRVEQNGHFLEEYHYSDRNSAVNEYYTLLNLYTTIKGDTPPVEDYYNIKVIKWDDTVELEEEEKETVCDSGYIVKK